MKQQHGTYDIKKYNKGLDADSNKEMAADNDDKYVDALNMRSLSMDGNNDSLKKIKGAVSTYPATDNRWDTSTTDLDMANYVCMMTQEINNKIVEIWAYRTYNQYSNPARISFVRVNGQIVLASENFPVRSDYPLQYDKNENVFGGDIYVTDNNSKPFILNVGDMVDKATANSNQYFANFNFEEYVALLSGSALYRPQFINTHLASDTYAGAIVIGSDLGLPVGQYSYSYRYKTTDGDVTSWSPATGQIPVVEKWRRDSDIFPAQMTHGKNANIANPTGYSNVFKIRIDNTNQYSSIEIRRDNWNAESNDVVGIYIIYEYSILSISDVQVLTFQDRRIEGLSTITIEEGNSGTNNIEKAKSIRFYNERLYLMNITKTSKDVSNKLNLNDTDNQLTPFVHKMGKLGHSDTYNAHAYKSYMNGDRYGFAVMLYDNNGNPTYGEKVPLADNYLIPNKREKISVTGKKMSYLGASNCATVNNNTHEVDYTFEVFDHENAVTKATSYDDFYNITDNANAVLEPSNQDSLLEEYNDPNDLVNTAELLGSGTELTYHPKGFGLDYYALGLAINKINIPDGYSGFSVVRTKPAERVIAQGLAMYTNDDTKTLDYIDVYFPDIDLGKAKYSIDFIKENYSLFSLNIVGALGFFTEVLAFANSDTGNTSGDSTRMIDMITYARVLNENGEINPSNTNGKVLWDKWFGSSISTSPLSSKTNVSTEVVGIEGAEIIYTGTGDEKYLRLNLNKTIYTEKAEGKLPPLYAVNLIQESANILANEIQSYEYIGNFQKLNSYLGGFVTQTAKDFQLVSERWEDCIVKPYGQISTSGFSGDITEKYVYVVDALGIEKRWLNVTELDNTAIGTILTDMVDNVTDHSHTDSRGNKIYGIYTDYKSLELNGNHVNYSISFRTSNYSGYNSSLINYLLPTAGSKVYVKYDKEIPFRFFGGDTFVNECVWSHVDNKYKNYTLGAGQTRQTINIGFPYKQYHANYKNRYQGGAFVGEYCYFRKRSGLGDEQSTIRQHINMWTAQTRANLSFRFGTGTDKNDISISYPLKNYVPRLYTWINDNTSGTLVFLTANGIGDSTNHAYWDAYGGESVYWERGGFKYKINTNKDYGTDDEVLALTSVPQINFTEQTYYPTQIVWSEIKPVNSQNSTSVKTFPIKNQFTISDDTGEIKFAWSALSENKGFNLYAFTDSGIVLLLVDKNIISQQDANQLFTADFNVGGISSYLFINKSIGMNDEFWRSWAEYSNVLFFCNRTSVYAFISNELTDIAKTGFMDMYKTRILPYIASGSGSNLCGVYDILHQEYILNFDKTSNVSGADPDNVQYEAIPYSIVYGLQQKALVCRSTYNYQKYLALNNDVYGMKNGVTYKLNQGNSLDGSTVKSYVTGYSIGEGARFSADPLYSSKEFIRIRVNSSHKPQKIYFFDTYKKYLDNDYSSVVDSTSITYKIKDYGGYECYIPRKSVSPYLRQQGRIVYFKIENNTDEDFLINVTMVQFKELK